MHNMYIIGKKNQNGVKLFVLEVNNRNFIVHIIVSGAQINHIFLEYSRHISHSTMYEKPPICWWN